MPHFSKCWAPIFNKDYAKNTEKDPELFALMNKMDHGENTFYEGWDGKTSTKLKNFLRYYVDENGNMTQIVEPNNPNLERGRYSLVNQEEGSDGIFGLDEDAMLDGMY